MWLAETAVDLATLEVLAEHGVRFTVLAPSQASRVRPLGSKEWTDVSGGRVDPSVSLRSTASVGTIDRAFLLRRAGFAGGRVREAADFRREPGRAA